MRIAVISDIHGNRLALEAVQEDIAAQGADFVVNLGDVVSGPLEPQQTVDILIDAGYATIRGNHDRWVTERTGRGLDPIDHFAASRLDAPRIEWLRTLPPTMDVLEDIFMCHGTPSSDTEPWLDNWWRGRDTTLPAESEVTAKADGLHFPVLLCGHTHLGRSVRLRDGRLVVNPGAVGLQINHGSPDARYALLDRKNGGWSATLRAVPYDAVGAARQAASNGFAGWSEALMTGWVGPEGLF